MEYKVSHFEQGFRGRREEFQIIGGFEGTHLLLYGEFCKLISKIQVSECFVGDLKVVTGITLLSASV